MSNKATVPKKQLPLFESMEIRPRDLDTDEDRQERARLAAVEKAADEQRHLRWQQHNATSWINHRECPCSKCTKARRSR